MNVYNIKMKTNKKMHCAKPAMQGFEFDNEVKLEKYYDGRKLRRYLQLLEISEQICRSTSTTDDSKKIAKTYADHYRRMVMCIVMKPFSQEEISTGNLNDQIFTDEMSKLNMLFDPEFKVK